MTPASGPGFRVILVQKEKHVGQLPHAKLAPPAQEDASLFYECCSSNTEQHQRSCLLSNGIRDTERYGFIGLRREADTNAGDCSSGEAAYPEVDSPITGVNSYTSGGNAYPVFVGDRVLESRDSVDPQLLQCLLMGASGTTSSVTSLHFFVDGSLPRHHLHLIESFANRLGCAECLPVRCAGVESAAVSLASSQQLPPKTQSQGTLGLTTGSPRPATQAASTHEQLRSSQTGLSSLRQRPARLWFLKGELGEGLKCRHALTEVQDALLFGNPNHSRCAQYITIPSSRLPSGEGNHRASACSHAFGGPHVRPLVEPRDAGATAARIPLDRQSLVFAVGGGTVCDLVAFAASTVLRGVKCVLVPTTLLAAIDASVGGKNGIDVGAAKNCLGTFTHPHAVLVHLPFIRSLPPRHFANGMAEVIKIATTSSSKLFDFLSRVDPAALVAPVSDSLESCATGVSNNHLRTLPPASPPRGPSDAEPLEGHGTLNCAQQDRLPQTPNEEPVFESSGVCSVDPEDAAAPIAEGVVQMDRSNTAPRRHFADSSVHAGGMNNALETVVLAAIQLKAAVVAEDFRESGKRQILNFGHTIGHGIEMLFRSSDWLHGECVAVGMVLELLLLRLLGLVSPLVSIRVQRLLRKFSLPCSAPLSRDGADEAFRLILTHDKKNRDGNIFITYVQDVGSTHPRHVTAVPRELVRLVLSPVLAVAPPRTCVPCSSLRSQTGDTTTRLRFDAVVSLPGSKSVANRVLLLAALRHCFIRSFRQCMQDRRPSRKQFALCNLPAAVDVVVMVHALQQLGLYGQFDFVASPSSPSFDVKVQIPLSACEASQSSHSGYFDPLAFADVSKGCLRLWVGDSGTASRFLLPFVAFLLGFHHCLRRSHCDHEGGPSSSHHTEDVNSQREKVTVGRLPHVQSVVVDGGEQLRRRPMGSLAEAVCRLIRGCRVSYLKSHGCLPIQLTIDEKVTAEESTVVDGREAQYSNVQTVPQLMSHVFTDMTEWHVSASESSQFGSALLMLAPLAPSTVQVCLNVRDELQDTPSQEPRSRVAGVRVRSLRTPKEAKGLLLPSSPEVARTALSHRKHMREECRTESAEVRSAGEGDSAVRRLSADPPSAAARPFPFVWMTQRLMSQWGFDVSEISSNVYRVCSIWSRVGGGFEKYQDSAERLARRRNLAGLQERESAPQRSADNVDEQAPSFEAAAKQPSPERGCPEGTCQHRGDDQSGQDSERAFKDSFDHPEWMVEADATAASYFMAMAAVAGGRVHMNVDRSTSLQGDIAFAEMLPHFGCSVSQRYGCPHQLFPHVRLNKSSAGSIPCRCPPHCPGSGNPSGEADADATGKATENISKATECQCCSGAWLTVESTSGGLQRAWGSTELKADLHSCVPLSLGTVDDCPDTPQDPKTQTPVKGAQPAECGETPTQQQLRVEGPQAVGEDCPSREASRKLVEIPVTPSCSTGSPVYDQVLTLDLSRMQDCFMTCAVLAASASRGTSPSNDHSDMRVDSKGAATDTQHQLQASVAKRPLFRLIAGRTARLKESDRIAAAARGLKTTGFHVDELSDGLLIYQVSPLPPGRSTVTPALTAREKNEDECQDISEVGGRGSRRDCPSAEDTMDVETSQQLELVAVESESDHRVAMSFAILGLVRTDVGIRDWQCVDKTFADFWYECKERIGMQLYAPPLRGFEESGQPVQAARESHSRDRSTSRSEGANRSMQAISNRMPEGSSSDNMVILQSSIRNRQAVSSPDQEMVTHVTASDPRQHETELIARRCGCDLRRISSTRLCETKHAPRNESVTREQLQRYFVICPPGCPAPSLVPVIGAHPSAVTPLPHSSKCHSLIHKPPAAPADQRTPEQPLKLLLQVLLVVGMRGVGKSVLGKLAALERGWAFFDLDVVLEAWLRDREDATRAPVDGRAERQGRTGIDLSGTTDASLLDLDRLHVFIEEEGMPAFRQVESQALAFLLSAVRRTQLRNGSSRPPCSAEVGAGAQSDEELCVGGEQNTTEELGAAFNSVAKEVFEGRKENNADGNPHSDATLQEFLMRCEALGLFRCRSGGCVVSCGGGVIESDEAVRALESEPLVVWIKTTEQETVERALRKEGQTPSYFQTAKKARRCHVADHEGDPSDSTGAGQAERPSEKGSRYVPAAPYREKVRMLYWERAVRYKKVAKFEFWTPPVQELLEGLDPFELSFWPALGDSKTFAQPPGSSAGAASDSVSPVASPSSSTSAALPLPPIPTDMAIRLALLHSKEAPKLSLYLRAVYKVWQLFLFALLGPPLPVTPASCFAVCEEVLTWSAGEHRGHSRPQSGRQGPPEPKACPPDAGHRGSSPCLVAPGSEATSLSLTIDEASCQNRCSSQSESGASPRADGASWTAGENVTRRRGSVNTVLARWLEESRYVDVVELRADCLPTLEAVERQVFYLRLLTGKPVIFTLRTQQDGGRFGPGSPLYRETVGLLSETSDESKTTEAQVVGAFPKDVGTEGSAHVSQGPSSTNCSGPRVGGRKEASNQACSDSGRTTARSATCLKTELVGQVQTSFFLPSKSSPSMALSVDEAELDPVAEAAAYVSTLARASRLGFDWIDVETRMVERLQTGEERVITEERKELWARAASGIATPYSGEDSHVFSPEQNVERSRHGSVAFASATPPTIPENGFAGNFGLSKEAESSLLRRARRQFIEDLLMATPPGGRYIASLHVEWLSSDPITMFYKNCLSSVSRCYAAVSKVVLLPSRSRLQAQTHLQGNACALDTSLLSTKEIKLTNLQVSCLKQDATELGDGEEAVTHLLRSLRMENGSRVQSDNTDARSAVDAQSRAPLHPNDEVLECVERQINRPLILLQSGPAGRRSRIENRCFTPTCLAGQDSTNAYGQLSAVQLWEHRRRLSLPCVNFFLFGYPTMLSPSPTIHNAIFECKRAVSRSCAFSLFPPAAVQRQMQQIKCPAREVDTCQSLCGLHATETAAHATRHPSAKLITYRQLPGRETEKYATMLVEQMTWQFLRAAPLHAFGGAAVTLPLKETLLPLLSRIDPVAKRIKAVNTIYRDKVNGTLCGANTDYAAIVKAILCRCDKVGTVPGTALCELPEEVFKERPLVVEMAYNPVLTPLIKRACGAGCAVVHGIELFVWQALIQSRYWVTSQGPVDVNANEREVPSNYPNQAETIIHCTMGKTCEYQKFLIARWLDTPEGRSYRPIDLRPAELREVLKRVETFYRNVIDVDRLVTLRGENFFV
ncbi:shikimate dehydrogenase substrate binding domain-containing protein [Toxoplasma gondii ME49]|uniref:Shikimate dehydrogenase substrate binding domain-containing protein n=2 Tax=Toxoplasma gondii TaxID=5811 RepID=A0A125YJI5_TOXGV|nr:shikimate dehydrogenase substrate binding domain-containing protein [Toxoplasma gondii ME49]EPT26362.1 shikimate dehydrogenase substrate binding domain-containing protein [Toxoplasma gondii ME49]ESS28295.1 shikimate dehydrogenase substrate binding domain-containing protein [Toxoplasma gondii VEG]|eukprot:XP_018635659.1 shikimate dehydrogenase substrate binding domain-containing protein [Toxoplasma gondii ME49]